MFTRVENPLDGKCLGVSDSDESAQLFVGLLKATRKTRKKYEYLW